MSSIAILTRVGRSRSCFFNLRNTRLSSRFMSNLPYHVVVGMPALSPTMEVGTISSWNVAEGDTFNAGDSLAEIETDKATIDFEAQDEGVVAKIFIDAGTGEIKIGDPIMVTVEDVEDVLAFKDFVPDSLTEKELPIIEEPVIPPVKVTMPSPIVQQEVPSIAAPISEFENVPPVLEEVSSAIHVGPAWGNLAQLRSPLSKSLAADQRKYIDKFGSTGQIPL